jgi:hypothetical protein
MEILQLLKEAGLLALKGGHNTDWMSMEDLTKLCKEHDLELQDKCPTPEDLETHLRPLFQTKDEVYHEGVLVVGMDRRVGWDLVFMLRFYRYIPMPIEEVLTACND